MFCPFKDTQESLPVPKAYDEQLTEKHDTTTSLQQNLEFRFRNLPKPMVTDLRQERDVFHHLKICRRVDLSRSPHRHRLFDILNHCLSEA